QPESVEAGTDIGTASGDPQADAFSHKRMASRSLLAVAGIGVRSGMLTLSAVSGSFSPLPVKTHTTIDSSKMAPDLVYLIRPATLAALDGSQNTPSFVATST